MAPKDGIPGLLEAVISLSPSTSANYLPYELITRLYSYKRDFVTSDKWYQRTLGIQDIQTSMKNVLPFGDRVRSLGEFLDREKKSSSL
jgi:hypothetical protein